MDVGDSRIGLAISDPLEILANPLETYHRKKDPETDADYIAGIVREKEVGLIVCGWPVGLNGQETEQTQKTKSFADRLRGKVSVEIRFMDERLTTACAERVLIGGGVRREDRKNVIDKVAATIILEDYLRTKKERS